MTLLADLRYALSRTPGFTLVVIPTIPLGIGATLTVISGVDPAFCGRCRSGMGPTHVRLDGPE